MANDQLIVSDEPDFFLEYLLRCALTAPGATVSPTAGRILARLLVVGAMEGGDELIAPYLVPAPGEDAAFDVRTYRPGDLVPTEVRKDLGAATALKIALRSARDTANGIEVVSRTPSGLERCALVRDSTGDFEFRFASRETLIGDPDRCRAALAAWLDLFAIWRGEVGLADGNDAFRPRPPAPTPVTAPAPPAAPSPPAARLAAAVAAPPPAPPRPDRAPEAGSGRRSPGWWVAGGTDEEDQSEVEAAPAAVSESDPESSAGGPAAELRAPEPVAEPEPAPVREPTVQPVFAASPPPPLMAPPEDLSEAIREAVGRLVVEVDLGQMEQLIRRLLDDERRDMIEPLARRLSARLGESLEFPDTRTLVEAVSMVLPQPGDLAEAVAADISALLSETVLRRRPGEVGVGIDAASLLAAIEKLHVRVDGLDDQFRKSAGILQSMGAHLDAGDRRAAIAERVTIAVDQEMQRLANRIDEQVSALAASAGGGSELSDGVARLTRKLRQSVVQLDRALERLDQVVDQTGGGRPGRLALARSNPPPTDTGPAARR